MWLRGSVTCPGVSCLILLVISGSAHAAELFHSPTDTPGYWTTLGESHFHQAHFEDAEAAWSRALDLEPGNAVAHLGLGRLASMRSDSDSAAKHYSRAYQAAPRNPDVVLAFAGAVQNREARRTLLQNFLTLAGTAGGRRQELEDVTAQIRLDEKLGAREPGVLRSPYESYRIPLSGSHQQGLILRARINGGRELRLLVDSGATGIVLNKAAGLHLDYEYVAPGALTGFGSDAPSGANLVLVASFKTGKLQLANLVIEVADSELIRDADGAIGLDVFKDFLIRVDPRSRLLELTPFSGSDVSSVSPDCVQAYRIGHLLLVRGAVNGKAAGYFVLDTGSPTTMLSPNVLSAVSLPGEGGRSMVVAGAQGSQRVAMPLTPVRLTLGARHALEFDYAMFDTRDLSVRSGVDISGAIGFSMLRNFSLTVNYRNGTVAFDNPGRN